MRRSDAAILGNKETQNKDPTKQRERKEWRVCGEVVSDRDDRACGYVVKVCGGPDWGGGRGRDGNAQTPLGFFFFLPQPGGTD